MKTVIGIGGKKRAGKSTLAGYIAEMAALRRFITEEVSFAQPIKEMMQVVFKHEVPWSTFIADDRKQFPVEIAPGEYMTVRQILQLVGTDCFRNIIHPDFWVARGIAKIKTSPADIVLVPDVRFGNELQALKQLGTTVFVEKTSELEPELDLHPSEMELDKIRNGFDVELVAPEGNFSVMKEFAATFVQSL